MVYCNPLFNWVGCHPLYTLNNQGIFRGSLNILLYIPSLKPTWAKALENGWLVCGIFSFLLGRFGRFFHKHVFFREVYFNPRFFTTFQKKLHVSLLKSSLAFLFFQLPCFPENIETPLSLGPTSEYDLQAPNAPNESIKEIHPGRLTWNQQDTHLERKLIFQTSMIMFHVNIMLIFRGVRLMVQKSGNHHLGCRRNCK